MIFLLWQVVFCFSDEYLLVEQGHFVGGLQRGVCGEEEPVQAGLPSVQSHIQSVLRGLYHRPLHSSPGLFYLHRCFHWSVIMKASYIYSELQSITSSVHKTLFIITRVV